MRRDRAKKLYIVLIITASVLLTLSGTLAVYIFSKNADSDDKYEAVFEEYAQCLKSADYERMYTLTDMSMEHEDFISRLSKIYSGIEAENISLEAVDIEKPVKEEGAPNARLIAYHMSMDTLAGHVEFANTVMITAHKEGKQTSHRIVWDHDMIFPDLTADDTVSVKTTKGKRGIIYDRNGDVLAGTGIVKSVGLIPQKMSANPDADIQAISDILGLSVEKINKKLNEKWVKPELFVPLKSLSENDVERKELLLTIPGVAINDIQDRVYPLGEAAAHLTGYIQSITAEELEKRAGEYYTAQSKLGKVGIEALFEDSLRGIDGCRIVILDKNGNEKSLIAERTAIQGEDVRLTIDASIQASLYEQFKEDKSSAAALNPNTGEVLAIISTPAYDPNEFILGVPEPLWEQWNTDERRPLNNRFKATFVPGSSFKPIIAAIGLTAGSFTADENFGYTGRSWQKDGSWGSYTITTLKDYGKDVSLVNAMVNSDNIYFARAALKIGAYTLTDALKAVGFGESIPFEFGISASSFGSKLNFGSEIELADSGYGQGKVLMSTLHMAALYSAFLNDGDIIEPHLSLNEGIRYWKKGVFSKEAASIVKESLIQVVESPNGTAHEVKLEGRRIGGKTGTAEIKDSKEDEEGTELGWFVAFNDDNYEPMLFVAMVEDVKGRGGSHYVTPLLREMFIN